jgi:hypothetical protein
MGARFGLLAEPDQKSIQVVALGDRVPPHTRRSVRHEVTSQEPVQEDIALQNGERPHLGIGDDRRRS